MPGVPAVVATASHPGVDVHEKGRVSAMTKKSLPVWWMPMDRPLRTHVIGVGCGAGRAMHPLCITRLDEVTCTAVNTDRAALQVCRAPNKILLDLTDGRDAGGSSGIGRWAAGEAYEQLAAAVKGADVVVIIACLGGGTGNGPRGLKPGTPATALWGRRGRRHGASRNAVR